MTVLSDAGIDNVLAPALAPAEQVIDTEHLARMTLGDRSLEREVLVLFDQQVNVMVARLDAADRAATLAVAHTLKGSAHGIGAWSVAKAAQAVECAARSNDEPELARAVGRLAAAVDETRVAIAGLLQGP